MKLLIIDSNNGAKTLIRSIKTVKHLDFKFVKLENINLTNITKNLLRDSTLKVLSHNLPQNYDVCIIMCISASSSILDILIKHNFKIANVLIIEPLIPICLYIKKHKFKTLLILSTQLTQKIRWFSRLLNINNSYTINYASLNLSENQMTNITKIQEAIANLVNYKTFIANCDAIVLGCSSYSLSKNSIAKELKSIYNFNGALLDSTTITFDYFNNYYTNYLL
jgi:glutamate racemase